MIQLSQIEKLSLMSFAGQQDYLSNFSEIELERLLQSYEFIARPKQLFPEGNWRTWLLLSGRGFGKTFVGSNWVIRQAQIQKYPIALIGANAADVRDYMVELGESSILRQSNKWFIPEYQPSKRRLIFPNGVIAITYGAENPEQLRGFNGNSAWVDELSKYQYPQEVWDNLNFALRIGNTPKIVITTTPRPIKVIKDLVADKDVIKTYGSTVENRSNLAPSFIDYVYKKYAHSRLGRQELSGELLLDTPGALWTYANLDQYRVNKYPELKQIVIAIDPAVSANEDSNETGIIVCGVSEDEHGYILEDKSGVYSPNEWAEIAINLYDKYKANYIVGETNNGGDLVESNIQSTCKIFKLQGKRSLSNVTYKKVFASRNKYTRAEPVSTLYEQGRVHHVGTFSGLEDQLCTWVQGEVSPDRLDALVWGLSKLLLKQEEIFTTESFW